MTSKTQRFMEQSGWNLAVWRPYSLLSPNFLILAHDTQNPALRDELTDVPGVRWMNERAWFDFTVAAPPTWRRSRRRGYGSFDLTCALSHDIHLGVPVRLSSRYALWRFGYFAYRQLATEALQPAKTRGRVQASVLHEVVQVPLHLGGGTAAA